MEGSLEPRDTKQPTQRIGEGPVAGRSRVYPRKGVLHVAEMRCGNDGRRFDVYFERSQGQLLRLRSAEPVRLAGARTRTGGNPAHPGDDRMILDLDHVDLAGLKCPFCGSTNILKCSCGGVCCAAGRKDGDAFLCQWCQAEAVIRGTFSELHASSLADRPSTTRTSSLRLPGNRRRLEKGAQRPLLDRPR